MGEKCGLDTCPCSDWPESMNRQVDFYDGPEEELTVVSFRRITQEEEDDNVW